MAIQRGYQSTIAMKFEPFGCISSIHVQTLITSDNVHYLYGLDSEHSLKPFFVFWES